MFLQTKAHCPFFTFSISKPFLNFLLTALLCFTSCRGNATTRCAETDKQTLLKLKGGFVHPSNFLSSWNDEVDCCKWQGISCNNLTGHVTELDLADLELGGKIDSSLCALQHLTLLNLSYNEFEAQKIPKCIGSLSQLRELNFSWMSLVGTIPRELGNLSNLQTLDFGSDCTNLFANDLEWMSHLSTLKYLDLSYVNLSRAVDWLSSISKFSSLSELRIHDCSLPVVNPNSYSPVNTSTSLQVLDLSFNYLNSSIMPWVLNVSKVLTHLDLSHNSFQGHIPSEFGTMPSLEFLSLASNYFEGGISQFARNWSQLKQLDLSSNSLSGKLSDSINQLCHVHSSMEGLFLSDNPFSWGAFPDLTRFSRLTSLDLRNTSLCGLLPQSLGHFPYLQHLELSQNNLSGPLPEFVGLPSLAFLDLSYNNLSGPLPKFAGLPSLASLDLSNNHLSGPLPEFADLPSLAYLDLSHNQLNGTLPYSMGQLSTLVKMYLISNNLNGVINEAHLWNLSALEDMDVSYNQLSFNFSSNWVPPFKLQSLTLSSCRLGPDFPVWLKNLLPVNYLDISNGGISNSIPTWFWDFSCLFSMNLSHNHIVGPFPKSTKKEKRNCATDSVWASMIVWDLSFNNLSGPLPQFPTNLTALQLSNNMLSGSFSSSFCATPNLRYLDLSNNLLSGKLPDCLGYLQNLEVLNLAKNNLSGRIPKAIGSLQQIAFIHLNDNNLSGEIPSLIHCHDLKSIDLGGNNLRGELPSWIGYNHTDLIVLRLKANRFQGSVPMSLCNLPNLQILDLSLNNITGQIPSCINNLTALSNTQSSKRTISYDLLVTFRTTRYILIWDVNDKAMLVWKGVDREYERNLGLMTTIDLSCNHLEGEIPRTITELLALASLNLSRNNLTGFIPNRIGEMRTLESLDLSGNHLLGTIPASFSSLSFLSYLNLSFNNLSGPIPLTTQLQTFNGSSYIGNQGLCGLPLTEKCPEDGSARTHFDDNDGEDKLTTFGFYVSIALGFITGFWGVCGTLVIKSSWRKAYFQFASNLWDLIYVRVALFIARMKRKFQIER